MVIHQGGKSHLLVAWSIQATRLKICDNHLTFAVANKCLKIREWVEVAD